MSKMKINFIETDREITKSPDDFNEYEYDIEIDGQILPNVALFFLTGAGFGECYIEVMVKWTSPWSETAHLWQSYEVTEIEGGVRQGLAYVRKNFQSIMQDVSEWLDEKYCDHDDEIRRATERMQDIRRIRVSLGTTEPVGDA